jgi:hypothetical protein
MPLRIKWDNCGAEKGQFNNTYNDVVDASGDVYITDTYNRRIQELTNPVTGETIERTDVVKLTGTIL